MSVTRTFKVGLIQMSWKGGREPTMRKAEQMIRQCAAQGASMVCLQELPFDPYFCQSEDHEQFSRAESLEGEVSQFSSRLARELGIVLLTGLFERRAPGLFHNTFLVFENDGRRIGHYRKTHIPDDPSYYEKFFFTPGEQLFPSFETSLGNVGICICWDQWFPEAARLTAMQGAEIIFFPTAIGWLDEDKLEFGDSQRDAWITMMKSHAIANGVYVCAANRVGQEQNIEFWGSSFVCDPYGKLLGQASRDQDQILLSEIDLKIIETARTHWPFFRDRRTDLYADICQKWRS